MTTYSIIENNGEPYTYRLEQLITYCGPATVCMPSSLRLASHYFSDSPCLIFALYLRSSQYRVHAYLFDSYAFICTFKGPCLLFYLVKALPLTGSHYSLLCLPSYGTHTASAPFPSLFSPLLHHLFLVLLKSLTSPTVVVV